MTSFRQIFALMLTFTLLVVTAIQAEDPLTNASVLEMQKMGLGEALIVQKISGSKCEFDTSLPALKELKDGGVPESVISAMLNIRKSPAALPRPALGLPVISEDPTVPHPVGIWLHQPEAEKRKMTKLQPRDCGRSSGWNKKSRAVLPGASALLQVPSPRPVFYYYAPPPASEEAVTAIVENDPHRLILARMEVRQEKNERRLALGKQGFFGDNKSGMESSAFVPVTVEPVAEGIFRLLPAQNLSVGEYCFIWQDQASREALKRGVVDLYDFGCNPPR